VTAPLFFIRFLPAVTVATEADQIVAASMSGVLTYLKRKLVDFRMGSILLAILVLAVRGKLALDLLMLPSGLYSLVPRGHA